MCFNLKLFKKNIKIRVTIGCPFLLIGEFNLNLETDKYRILTTT